MSFNARTQSLRLWKALFNVSARLKDEVTLQEILNDPTPEAIETTLDASLAKWTERFDEDVNAFICEMADLFHLANIKQERIDRIRKDLTITADNLRDAESKHKTRANQANYLGISERHLRRLRARLLE